jgi:uncharacterized protein involved in exopolysaccharide biosynthesis
MSQEQTLRAAVRTAKSEREAASLSFQEARELRRDRLISNELYQLVGRAYEVTVQHEAAASADLLAYSEEQHR